MKKRVLAAVVAAGMVCAACAGAPAETVEAEEVVKPPKYSSVSVHDPSVIRAEDGVFYIFGSHMAAAKSDDLNAAGRQYYEDAMKVFYSVYGE